MNVQINWFFYMYNIKTVVSINAVKISVMNSVKQKHVPYEYLFSFPFVKNLQIYVLNV